MNRPPDDGQPKTIGLPSSAEAPGIARAHIREYADVVHTDILDDTALLVSELVTNAVLHGYPEIRMRIRIRFGGVAVEVLDEGATFERGQATIANPSSPTGRGLLLVEALATAWGVDAHQASPGKTVWFELGSD